MATLYSTPLWKAARARALARDSGRCTVSRMLGGRCSPSGVPLHVHHIVAVEDGGFPYALDNLATVCNRHHPQWEQLRRLMARKRSENEGRVRPRCPHTHRSLEARLICEARLSRGRQRQLA